MWDAIAALVEQDGYRLTAEPETGGGRGHTNYTERLVNIDPGLSAAEQAHVLIHELGHIRAGHDTCREMSRAQRETEAESVAFIVATVLGLDVGDVTAVYVGGWIDGDPDTRSPPRRPRSTTPPAPFSPTLKRTSPTRRTPRAASPRPCDGGGARGHRREVHAQRFPLVVDGAVHLRYDRVPDRSKAEALSSESRD